MNSPTSHPDPLAAAQPAALERPPSQAWERLESPDRQAAVWAWFWPANAPQSLILRVPDEAYQGAAHPAALPTMRKLFAAAAIDPTAVSLWYLYGVPYDAMQGASPYLDAPIPPPVAGIDPNIVVYLHAAGLGPAVPAYVDPAQLQAGGAAFSSAAPAHDLSAAELFDRIETDWHGVTEIDRELGRLRKMLVDQFHRLKTLNRDLNPTERQHANNQDKQDWLDARRWLREGSNRLWRCIKEHDIGDISTAGQKGRFEQLYRDFVVPRIAFDGLLQAQRDFESYRKLLQNVQNNMSTAHTMASTDGERRANQVLGRIAAKVRDAQTKRNFFGMVVD